jgi:hypothetical protein
MSKHQDHWHKADSENDVLLEMHHVRNYEEFSWIDNNSFINLQSYNENEDCEEATVEKLQQNTRRH